MPYDTLRDSINWWCWYYAAFDEFIKSRNAKLAHVGNVQVLQQDFKSFIRYYCRYRPNSP